MSEYNLWVECLDCGQTYSADNLLVQLDAVDCPSCLSNEYIPLNDGPEILPDDYLKLNESLMEDGEWN